MEVRYSINGNYFADFGVFVSESKGIADALKRKKVNSYDWAEYHGISVDLERPKYEARNIELRCFIVGDNWEELFSDFNKLIRDEFSKPGTQRLLIEPFGYKAMPYEVYMSDDINVEKQFREGKMHAIFSIKMIEPNPVKKVLYFTGDKLDLSFSCPSETEIFYGNGLKETAQGNVSLSGKALPNRSVSGYNFEGRNYYPDGSFTMGSNVSEGTNNVKLYGILPTDFDGISLPWMARVFSIYSENPGDSYALLSSIATIDPGHYILSFFYKSAGSVIGNSSFLFINGNPFRLDFSIQNNSRWNKVDMIIPIHQKSTAQFRVGFVNSAPAWMNVTRIKLEKGSNPTPWTPAPEDERYIVVAGNIEEITNLQTNAQVLWERL